MKKGIFLIMSILFSLTMAGCKKEESFVDTMAQGVNDFVDQAIVGEEGEVFTITESSLQKILEINELSTIEYTYNSIKKVNGKIKYTIYYSGRVKAGIDFKDIIINVDDENKMVNIKLPEAKIISCIIDDGSLDYIFDNEKNDTYEIHNDALALANNDLSEKVNENKLILDLAKENSFTIVEELLKPWIEYANYSYTIE